MGYSRKLARFLPLCAAAALALPAVAQADNYCVATSGPGCTPEGDVQAALTAAQTHAGEDTVTIGPGTFTAIGNFNYTPGTSGNLVHVVGSGLATELTSNGGTNRVLVLGGPVSGSTVANLAVRIPSTAPSGTIAVEITGSSVDGVTVTSAPGLNSPYGFLLDGSSLRHSSVDVTNAAIAGTAVRTAGGITAVLEDDVLKAAFIGLETHYLAQAYRLDITANRGIVAGGNATTVCESCLIRLTGSNARGGQVDPDEGGGLVVRLSTIVGGGSGAIGVDADEAGGSSTMNVNVFGSIIRGPELSMHRNETGGTVNLFGDGNDYESLSNQGGSNGGSLDPGAHSITADPKFVDPGAGDYRLRGDSPAIDAASGGGGPDQNTDLAGNPRKVGADYDMGAYEHQRRAPSVTASATASVFTGHAATFTASGSDPDGDPLTYTWSFDDGGTAAGASAQHGFATPGVHTATVTVHDPAAQTASAGTSTIVVALPPQVTAPLVPPTILNTFTFGKLKLDTKHGWVILVLNLPGAGNVNVLGTATAPSKKLVAAKSKKKKPKKFTAVKTHKSATKAGVFAITLKPGKAAMKLLKQKRSLKVPLKITFTPTGGNARSTPKTVTFKLKKAKKKR